MFDWIYPDALHSVSPWLRWSVAAVIAACTGFMFAHNYPWSLLLYIDAVLVGFGWAMVFHVAADRRRVPSTGIRSGRELDVGRDAIDRRQLAIRGWQLFGMSLCLGVVGMVVLTLLFAGT